jgi:WD40 repeat protein
MIFELLQDLDDSLANIPQQHSKKKTLEAIADSVRRYPWRIEEVPESVFSLLYIDLIPKSIGREQELSNLLNKWARSQERPWVRYVHFAPSTDFMDSSDLVLRTPWRRERAALAYAPDDNILLSVSERGQSLLWNLKNGNILGQAHNVPSLVRKRYGYECNASSLPERFILRIENQTTEFQSIQELSSWDGYSLHVTGNDRRVLLHSEDKNMFIRWRPHDSFITSLIYLGSHERFATASYDGEIALWNVPKIIKRKDHDLEGHTTRVRGIDINPNGTKCISIDLDGKCVIWDMLRNQIIRTFQLDGYFEVGPFVSFSHKSELALVRTCGGEIQLIDTKNFNSLPLTVDLPSVRCHHSPIFEREFFLPLCYARYGGLVLWQSHFFPSVLDVVDFSWCCTKYSTLHSGRRRR